jgi:hypothetical protein
LTFSGHDISGRMISGRGVSGRERFRAHDVSGPCSLQGAMTFQAAIRFKSAVSGHLTFQGLISGPASVSRAQRFKTQRFQGQRFQGAMFRAGISRAQAFQDATFQGLPDVSEPAFQGRERFQETRRFRACRAFFQGAAFPGCQRFRAATFRATQRRFRANVSGP